MDTIFLKKRLTFNIVKVLGYVSGAKVKPLCGCNSKTKCFYGRTF